MSKPDTAADRYLHGVYHPNGHCPNGVCADPMTTAELMRKLCNKHLEDNPDCPYGDQPHFVPPSFGQVGFYACNPPKDATNHTRCRPPYDHEHEDHHA